MLSYLPGMGNVHETFIKRATVEPTYIHFIFSMLKCIFYMSILLLNDKYNKFVVKETTAT